MRDDVSLKKMFVLSILLHLLLLLIPLKMFIEDAREAQAQELEKERDNQREMSFIFVETPETATESEHQDPTPFVSDKTLAAANPEAPADLPAGQPYQQGRQSEIAVMSPEQPQPPGATPRPPQREQSRRQQPEEGAEQQEQPGEQGSFDGLRELEALSRLAPRRQEQPLPSQPDLQQPPGAPGSSEAPRFDNRRTRAPMGADFQLSTYNWNWAPYLKELKKRIESNIYPPPAFFMGMARGRTFLRFTIQKDGTITNFEMITYTGHESLMKTSVNAIEASVPFLPLPSDFPENELGITCGFYYNEFMQERP